MSQELMTRKVVAVVARAANHLVCTLRRRTYRVRLYFRRRRRRRLLDANDDATRNQALSPAPVPNDDNDGATACEDRPKIVRRQFDYSRKNRNRTNQNVLSEPLTFLCI